MTPQEEETVTCPVCRRADVKQTPIRSALPPVTDGRMLDRTQADDGYGYDCPRCGRFAVTRDDRSDFLTSDSARARWFPDRLSALLREQTISGRPPFWIRFQDRDYGPLDADGLAPIHAAELLARWPRTVPERLERTLCNLARRSLRGGDVVQFIANYEPLAFAETQDEAQYHIHALIDRKDLEVRHSTSAVVSDVVLTASGWQRFEELTRGASAPENPVFVAMWFGVQDEKKKRRDWTDAESRRVFEEGILRGVNRAQYKAIRVDLVPFNGAVMDQVFGDIRAAPFAVADLTGSRPGVYLEAGFARGLGREVIFTCAHSHKKDVHFDVKHFNLILWKDTNDLQDRLYHRIRGVIGIGPYPAATTA